MPTYVQLTCVICNATFEKEYKLRNHKTCSKECSNILRQETRRKQHEPVDKECDRCGETFQDTSKKKQVTTCKPCVYTKMVESRLANNDGAYHSEEWCNNRSEQYKDGMPWLGKPQQLEIISRKRSEWIQQHPEWSGKRGKGGYREDLDCWFRSEWEAAYARSLNASGTPWEYELYSFPLSSGKHYLPDFYLPETDEWVEVKGWWDEGSIQKCDQFETDYPNETLVKIDSTNYNIIRPFINYTTKENK